MSERNTAVLFADVSGSTRLYESAGDAVAHDAIARCIDVLVKATEAAGGRVIKTIGDEIMGLFGSPDSAAGAAAAMHAAIGALPAVNQIQLAVRIGFHAGPVIQRDGDVFGDTVNVAARLVELARAEQILTSNETAAQLGGLYRAWTRQLYAIAVKGKAEEVGLCELVWRADSDVTTAVRTRPNPTGASRQPITLRYMGRELVRRRDIESIKLGRDNGCDLVVASPMASRQHCTIERRSDKWVLTDHSTNGTFVTVDGDSEVVLRREELVLRRSGWITFGGPLADAGSDARERDSVAYSVS